MSEIGETLDNVNVDIEVVLGSTKMPVHQILRMGRGAVIELNATEMDDVIVMANNTPIAKAGIVVNNGHIGITITKLLKRLQAAGEDASLGDEVSEESKPADAPDEAKTEKTDDSFDLDSAGPVEPEA